MDSYPPPARQPGRLTLHIVCLLIVITAVAVRIRLLGIPLERDEGEYAYTGQLILKGVAPYAAAYTMKLPGVSLCFALCMAIFGQSIAGIHLGLLAVNLLTTTLIYLLGKKLFDQEAASAAAGFYALLAISQHVLGIFAHATHFVVLFSLAGILLLCYTIERERKLLFFASGLCFGLAFLMKQHAAILLPFVVYCQLWRQRKRGSGAFAVRSASLLAGAAAPYAAVALWLFNAGVFDKFWFWTVQYASAYATGNPISTAPAIFFSQIRPILLAQLPVWILAGGGAAILCSRERRSGSPIMLVGYLIASFVMISPGYYFRSHYFILVLPWVALLAGYGAASIPGALPRLFLNRSGRSATALVVALAAACCLYAEWEYFFRWSPLEVSRVIYGANPFPEAIPIADYLRRNTTESDRIAILGSEPEILFYSGRISATGHIYMYGLMEKHRYADRMQALLIEEIEKTAPKFIVVVHNSASWLLSPDSLNSIMDWGDRYIPLRYDEVGIIDIPEDGQTGYFWDEAAVGRNPESEYFVSVFRKRW